MVHYAERTRSRTNKVPKSKAVIESDDKDDESVGTENEKNRNEDDTEVDEQYDEVQKGDESKDEGEQCEDDNVSHMEQDADQRVPDVHNGLEHAKRKRREE